MPWSANVVKRVLPTGLTLLVQRDATAPVVAVVTHVRAGYFDEPDQWVGIAHVLEHMYFKGTARRAPGDIARETQMVGGYINAGTIYDKTIYYTVLPSSGGGMAQALDVQADALMHATLDPDELVRELEVIIQEANRKLDTPSAVTGETLYELLFRVHRMRRWRIGTEAELRRLSARDLREYYESRYTPDRVIVAVVGDVDPERVLDLATATYAEWRRPTAVVEASPAEPDGDRAAIRVLHGDVQRPLASMGWQTTGTLHADAPALDVTATVLGQGRGSRLYRALRLPGVAASAQASHVTPTEVGVFQLDLEAEPDRIDEAVERAWDQVSGLGLAGPAPAELERALALIETACARRNETMEGRASALCDAEALGSYELVDELYAATMGVTAADVQRVVELYAKPERLSAVVYLPEYQETGLERSWPPQANSRAAPPSVTALPQTSVVTGVGSEARTDGPGGVVHWSFPRADVLVRPKPGAGVVTLMLHFPRVPAEEPPANAGISWLVARTAIRGAGGMSGEELSQSAELAGGAIAPSVGAESMGWSITVRPDAVGHAAGLLGTLARAAHLGDHDVRLERELQASDARRVRDDMLRHPLQRVMQQAFPQHAYGSPALGEPDIVAQLEARELREWSRQMTACRPVIVAVGELDAEGVIDALAPLSEWEVPDMVVDRSADAPMWTAGRDHEARDKKQTALAMAFAGPRFSSRGRFAATVAGSVLSGLAGRLFEELREKRALAYTVAAMPWLARRAGVMLCYIATAPEQEDEARTAMLTELERLAVDPPTPTELERARNYAAGAVEIRRQSSRAIASEILEAWVHGTLADLADTPGRLRAVTRDDVVRVAEQMFRADERAEYVVRGASS
ncbi:MAG: insulinase family protein [Gemmatimonadota bacterium]|nr:insulinase family protein [Gemmatimonadota bacterium]